MIFIQAREKALFFSGDSASALALVESLHGAYASSDMPKMLNDFVFNIEVALQNAGVLDEHFNEVLENVNHDSLTKEDLLEDPHHPDCPAFDGFGCRCEEIERENHESI